MISSNYFEDNSDLQLHVNQLIDWNEIVELYEDGFADAAEYKKSGNERLAMAPSSVDEAVAYYKELLFSYGEICGKEMSQIAQAMDARGLDFKNGVVTHPPEIESLYHKFHDAGLAPTSFQRRYGGLGIPTVVKALAQEISYRADGSMSITVGCVNLAAILEMYADREMKDRWIPKLIGEKYAVTMGLSEPDFGSDLPNVRTRAELIDGRWFITGTKRFQTMACGVNGAPSALLVLARSGEPGGGSRGLSFFLVDGKDVQIIGLEKKLGLKASATCEVAFERAPAELIGQEGYGLVRYVIGMLNGARMSVASQGTGIGTAALFEARKYAEARIQFGKPIAQIPAVRRMLERIERETAAMRMLMIESARSVDRYHWRLLRQIEQGVNDRDIRNDEEIRRQEKVASTLTPMAKYYSSETCNSLAYDGIQVLGGAGFTEDYDLARIYRDARITNIYDGTTQIQVNAAIGGVTAGMAPAGHFRLYLQEFLDQHPISTEARETYDLYESIVSAYKGIGATETKEELAFEVVEAATRLVVGFLFDKSVARLSGAAQEKRRAMARLYHIDSVALLGGHLHRLRARASLSPAAAR